MCTNNRKSDSYISRILIGKKQMMLIVMRELVIGTVVLVGLLQMCNARAAEAQSHDVVDTNVAPYLLFSTTVRIYRMNLNGSDREELVYERNNGILGLEYHYRLNSLFWTNVFDPSIKQANLNGSNVRRIVTNGPGDLELRYPVDLALDWINDKLYWTDRDAKKIGVYDLVTAERRVILSTGTGSDSLPFGLAVYPFPDYGWLYWVDRGKETLEVATVTGEGREILESGQRLSCAWPLTVDYAEHTIYWINYCSSQMHSISMDGSINTQSFLVRNILFPYGISILNDTVFWTQGLSARYTDKLQGEPIVQITTTLSNEGGARGIEAVHPLQQPPAEVFREIVDTGTAECDPPCANGDCVDPSLCYCDRGWTGLDCLTDINECEISNRGCDHTCTDFIDSFECSCRRGYALKNDNRTCEDINECEILNGGCEYNCTNSEGSYECSCLTDFVLGIDGRSCACLDGYATEDNITCEDINECEISNGGCDHNCSNSEGSYECSCLPHFVLNLDDRSCNDIDECLIANGGCPQLCINLPGSYECGCFDGYNMIEVTICEDINECKSLNGGCLHNCTNLEGSYECSCLEGFTLSIDGRNCDVVVETTTFPTPTPTSLVLATSTTTSIPTSPPDETSPVLEASRSSTSITPSFVTNPQQNSTPHPSPPRPLPSSSRHITATSSSSTHKIVPSHPSPTIPPRPLPSSSRPITASSSSSSHKISGFVNPSQSSATVPALQSPPITTSSTHKIIPSQSSATVPALQSPPITTSNTQMPVDTDHSISTTHTRPSMSMDSSPTPDIAESKPSSSTMLVIVAAAASAGVLVLAVVVVIIAIIVYRKRAHKSASWSPPRNTADSLTDSIKFTGPVMTTAAVIADSNG